MNFTIPRGKLQCDFSFGQAGKNEENAKNSNIQENKAVDLESRRVKTE